MQNTTSHIWQYWRISVVDELASQSFLDIIELKQITRATRGHYFTQTIRYLEYHARRSRHHSNIRFNCIIMCPSFGKANRFDESLVGLRIMDLIKHWNRLRKHVIVIVHLNCKNNSALSGPRTRPTSQSSSTHHENIQVASSWEVASKSLSSPNLKF